jgi:hypothetical protein
MAKQLKFKLGGRSNRSRSRHAPFWREAIGEAMCDRVLVNTEDWLTRRVQTGPEL